MWQKLETPEIVMDHKAEADLQVCRTRSGSSAVRVKAPLSHCLYREKLHANISDIQSKIHLITFCQ